MSLNRSATACSFAQVSAFYYLNIKLHKIMNKVFGIAALLLSQQLYAQQQKAPAYPLITHDPYFSVWSATDDLTASTTRHWTGTDQSITGLVKVDGVTYRVLGAQAESYESIAGTSDE